MIKADILEDDKIIICANKKQIKLINYGVVPITSKVVLDITNDTHFFTPPSGLTQTIVPEITDLISYDTTGLIYVGFNSFRVISYDLPEFADTNPAFMCVQKKVYNLLNIF